MWLANRLFPSVRRLRRENHELRQRLANSGSVPRQINIRSHYKANWNDFAATDEAANNYVSGHRSFAEMRDSAEKHLAWIQETVGIRSSDVALEIGCGVGRMGQVIAPLCSEWIGCDVSANMIAIARRNLAGFPNARFAEVTGYDLASIPDESTDLVYCVVVFMHLCEWDRYNYVLEAFRTLKPGGRIFVDNVNLSSPEGWRVFEQHRSVAPAERGPEITTTSTPDEIRTYLERAGFSNVTCRARHLWIQGFGVKPA